MESTNFSNVGMYTDIRYKNFYALLNIALALAILALILIMKLADGYLLVLWIILIPFLLVQGTLALRGRKYLRLDKQNKILFVDGSLGIREGKLTYYRKYKYDRIYFITEGQSRSLYIDSDEKRKYIAFSKFICNKSDLENFCSEINT